MKDEELPAAPSPPPRRQAASLVSWAVGLMPSQFVAQISGGTLLIHPGVPPWRWGGEGLDGMWDPPTSPPPTPSATAGIWHTVAGVICRDAAKAKYIDTSLNIKSFNGIIFLKLMDSSYLYNYHHCPLFCSMRRAPMGTERQLEEFLNPAPNSFVPNTAKV